MARDRWTLALIILCLPILATVITAFRVRDLPKAQDSPKLQTKQTQQCEHCDVKVHKVHSDKIESGKHRNEDLIKTVREKQLLVNQKFESKSSHKYDVKSDEDEDDDDDMEFPKVQTGFRQEASKLRKLEKSGPLSSSSKTVVSKGKFKKDNDDNDDDEDADDEEDDEDDDKLGTIKKNANIGDTKKPGIQIVNAKHVTKVTEVKTAKIAERKVDSIENNNDDAKNGNDDDEDNDDNYDGLNNIEELFKILHMEKKSDSKSKQDAKAAKPKVSVEEKNKPVIKIEFGNDDDDDDDEDEIAQKPQDKKISSSKVLKTNKETEEKKIIQEVKGLKAHEMLHEMDSKEKNEHKHVSKQDNKEDMKNEQKIKPSPNEIKKTETSKKEDKSLDKKSPNSSHESSKGKETSTEKTPKIDKKDESKSKDKSGEATSKETSKKIKEPEKVLPKPKIQEKETKHPATPDVVKKIKEPNKQIDIEHKKQAISDTKKLKKEESKPDYEPKKSEIKPKSVLEDKKHMSEPEEPQILSKIREKHSSEKLYNSEETSTSHLKHVTEALHRRNLLKSEFEDFYSFFPTFAPNFSRIHNAECRRHGQIVLRQLRGTKLWALNMLDATAKIPSGVLQGNGIQLGDFDQCIESQARVKLDTGSVVKVQGQYCLARIDVKAEHSELEGPVYLAQAKSLIRSKIDDPGHFVPRFSTLSWGVCVPSACNPDDVEVILKDAVKHYQHTSGVVIKIKVDEEDCYTDEGDSWEEWLELPTILTLSIYAVIVLLVLVATVQDFLTRRPSEEEADKAKSEKEDDEEKKSTTKSSDGFLRSFSLYYSISKLIAPGTSDEIACIHGIRGIATLALLVAHKFLPVAVMPYTNRVKISEIASLPVWSWCRAGWIFTDSFLLLSGVLTAHRISSSSDSSALRRLFSRYMRLTPALLAVVLFYAYVWDKVSVGPMWGTFVTKNAEVCQESWWWNMLYVQNYFGFEDMCAPQTHQLALDMQLTILGGIIVWFVDSGQGLTKLILPSIHIGAAYLRYTTVRDHRLTLLAYHGVSVSQLYRTARLSYMSTIQRCSPYLIGISLGLALRKPAKHGKIVLCLGWLTSCVLWSLVLWAGMDSGSTQYRYSATYAAQYATIAPLASAVALAWVIYAVHNETCEFLAKLLCCRPLVYISRLSYAMYLCQFIIFITNIGTVKTSREFTLSSLIDVQEILAVIISSTILTLTFVIPMQSLHKIFTFSFQFNADNAEPVTETNNSEPKVEAEAETEIEPIVEETTEIEVPVRNRQNFLAHREVLEEIPEVEVEYETQREKIEGLDEILEEEEGTIGDEEEENIDDLEIIEEEEAGEEEAWNERNQGERSYSRNGDQDLDEWEWTSNGRNGAQYYRYTR